MKIVRCCIVFMPPPLGQVPREKRRVCSSVKASDPSVAGEDDSRSLETLDGQLQALRSMPVNLSLNSSGANATAEHQASKYAASCLAAHTRDVKCNVGLSAVKVEDQSHVRVPCSGEIYREESREHSRMVYEQSHYDLPLAGFILKEERRGTPDSTNGDNADREVRCLAADTVEEKGGECFTWHRNGGQI